ncbi:MAG: ABC transporter substrate-binding protein [Spirochaetaceae bacterium]|nr:ABC transporter substrate-binding protein [Spirochaetaceae bacterium]
MKRVLTILVLLAAAAVLFANGANDGEAKPIKLGAVWPLADITGDQAAKAAQQAVEEINAAGGVMGRPLELIVIDSEFKPDKGAAALERLATVDQVDVFIGGMSSGVHLGQIPTLKKYKKLTVWTGAASHLAEEAVGSDADWYFHLHPWDYNQGQSYVDGWSALGEKYSRISTGKWFLAYEDGAFGSASFDASKALFADMGEFDGDSFTSAAAGGGDYTAVLETAKAAKPDIFLWAGYGADALPIMEQAKSMGFAPPLFVGAPPGWPADFGDSSLAEGVTLYGMWAPSLNGISDVSKKFSEGYEAKYGAQPATYFAPLGYSAVYMVADAIERAGSLETDALVTAMKASEYDSPLGETITFSPSKVIQNQGIRGQKILQWQNGEQEVIWPFEYQTAEPAYPFPAWDER